MRKVILLCFSTDWEQFIGGIFSKHVTQIQKTQWVPRYAKKMVHITALLLKKNISIDFFFLRNLFHEAGQAKDTMHFFFSNRTRANL